MRRDSAAAARNGNNTTAQAARRKGSLRVVVPVLVVLTFVGVPAGRFLLQPEPDAATSPPAPVVVGLPRLADAERTVRYTGNLTPESTTMVLPRVGGRVTELRVRLNQPVQAGDVIARVEDDALRLQVAQARAAYEAADAQYRQAVRGVRSQELEIARAELAQAEATLETARGNLDRTRRMFEGEAVSRREYEEAVDRFATAETQVANARRSVSLMEVGAGDEELAMARANADAALRQLELAQLQLDHATIRAPVAGTIARVFVEAGQTVGAQSPVVALVNDRLIYAKIRVPERLYGEFQGREAEMEVRIFPEAYQHREPFTGTVTAVASVVDSSSRTFEVEVAIPNPDARLRPGMFVNAVFVLEAFPQAVHVAESAVQRRPSGTVVYVVIEDGADARVVARPVRTGQRREGQAMILEGIGTDDRIVIEGGAFLSDGDLIRVVGER